MHRIGITLCLLTIVSAVRAENAVSAVPSFKNDIIPILTRYGCNQGACHGKGAGQNGFRLSLRGYAPEADYQHLTHEFLGRRSDLVDPESSALIRKPLGLAPHEGGKLFSSGSRPHQMLVAWLRAGMPGPKPEDPTAIGLDIIPGGSLRAPGQEAKLIVTARYPNGQQRDVTWLCKFESNDPGVATVRPDGTVRVLRQGETAIRAAFQTQVAVLIVSAPYNQPVDAASYSTKNNFIDDHVFNKLAALHIEPSGLSSDAEFVRRAYLNTIGVLPTPEEARAFLQDASPDKRRLLIDQLLARPEFVDYWTLFLSDLLQNRKERDHDVRGSKGVRAFHEWLRRQVATNRPWNELARDVLTAHGDTTKNPAVGYFIVTVGEHGEPEKSEVVGSVAQSFLGTRIGCAQCHNHPLERYTQDDYYHFAAYFSRLHFDRHEAGKQPTMLALNVDREGKARTDPVGVHQPRTGEFMKPQPLDRSAGDFAPNDDPRARLADWMVDPKNELFAGAMVNRIWKQFFGVGLVEPVDDLRASNPPSNPELWRALVQEFVANHYDMRHLMRIILNSRSYQLTSNTRPSNAADGKFFSHYYPRRLPAEVMLDALCQSTGVPEPFDGYPLGIRATQMPDAGLKSYFLPLFGKSDRVTACACERNGEVTMPQLLHLQNGQTVIYKINDAQGALNKLLHNKQLSDDAVIDELYLGTLSRPAPPEIHARMLAALAENQSPNDAFRARMEVFRDLFWALLNSKEFAFVR